MARAVWCSGSSSDSLLSMPQRTLGAVILAFAAHPSHVVPAIALAPARPVGTRADRSPPTALAPTPAALLVRAGSISIHMTPWPWRRITPAISMVKMPRGPIIVLVSPSAGELMVAFVVEFAEEGPSVTRFTRSRVVSGRRLRCGCQRCRIAAFAIATDFALWECRWAARMG